MIFIIVIQKYLNKILYIYMDDDTLQSIRSEYNYKGSLFSLMNAGYLHKEAPINKFKINLFIADESLLDAKINIEC